MAVFNEEDKAKAETVDATIDMNAETSSEEKKEKASGFGKAFMNVLDKGIEVSKKGLKSAGIAINDFGEKSSIKIEKFQTQKKIDEKYAELGKYAVSKFNENAESILKSDEAVSKILDEIAFLVKSYEELDSKLKEEK